MAYKTLNQKWANFADEIPPTACFCKQNITGTLPYPSVSVQYGCGWLLQHCELQGRVEHLLHRLQSLKHLHLALWRVNLPTPAPTDWHLVLTPLSTLHLTSHDSLLAAPEKPHASSQVKATAPAALPAGLLLPYPATARLACTTRSLYSAASSEIANPSLLIFLHSTNCLMIQNFLFVWLEPCMPEY